MTIQIDDALVERLAAHRMLAGVPREQLQWLARRSTAERFEAGAVLVRPGEAIARLLVILAGRMVVRISRGGPPRKVAEWVGGDISGRLPYSRMSGSPGTVVAEEPTDALSLGAEYFPEMARECFDLTSVLVHVMVDRARLFRADELQDEKMRSLGRLSAGVAHELNNPASAAARSAKSLAAGLADLEAGARAVGALNLTAPQLERLATLRDRSLERERGRSLSPLERADLEDAFADWLERHGLDGKLADTLVDASLEPSDLDALAADLDPDALRAATRYLVSMRCARRLTQEIETAAGRIHALVSAVKGHTYMDQAPVPTAVDIGRGLADTLTLRRSKAKARRIDLQHDVEPGLPPIEGFGGELNQVWGNLIDNAIEAAPEGGHVTVTASSGPRAIVVRVTDDGPGIPPDVRDRIFDPFFTTKGVGEGAGLGLDMVRRAVERHGASIDVRSGPGGTTFTVTLPLGAQAPQASGSGT